MAFNGSGTFNRLYNWTNDAANGVKIRADRTDAEDNGFATGLSNVICKDGQTTTTASIPFAAGINVTGQGQFNGYVTVGFVGNAFQGTLQVRDSTIVGGSPQTSGSTDTNQIAMVAGATSQLSTGFDASNNVWCQVRNSGNFATNYNLLLQPNGGNVTVGSGGLNVTGDVAINTNKFNITASSGNTTIAGTVVSANTKACFAANASGTQSIPNNANTLLAFDTEVTDPSSAYDNTAGNYKFTAPITGTYAFNANVTSPLTSGNNYVMRLFKNGVQVYQFGVNATLVAANYQMATSTVFLALTAGDYVQAYFFQDSGSSKTVTLGQFNGFFVSA